MEKLKVDASQTGGMPAKLNDIEYEQNGIIKAIKGLGRTFRFGDTFICDGMQFTESLGLLTHSPGVVMLDGEICEVDALSGPGLTIAGNYIYLEKIDTYEPTGLKTFEDATTKDTYLIRKAKLTAYGSVQAGKVLYSNLITAVLGSWSTLTTDWDDPSAGSNQLLRTRYRRVLDGSVEIVFRLFNLPAMTGNIYASATQIALVPVGFRPDRPYRFSLICDDQNDALISQHNGFLTFLLDTDGKLYFTPRYDPGTASDQAVLGSSIWLGIIRIPLKTT